MIPARTSLLVALWAALAAAPVRAGEPADLGPVVEEVIAVVGDRIVTRTELELEARVVLVDNGGVEAAFGALDAETLASVLDWLVNQMLIVEEVDRLEVFEVPREEVEREVARFSERFPDPAALEAFLASQDVGADRVSAIFRRNLRVKRYLDSRVKLLVRVEDAEVRSFYGRHSERFGGRPLDEVRDVIRGFLFKQRYEETVRRLLQELRAKAHVDVLSPPEAVRPISRGVPVGTVGGVSARARIHAPGAGTP